ncbi:MAG: carboxypeptidase-like regulatory domain-containing protein, partial [Saprospiraceae bacterium]
MKQTVLTFIFGICIISFVSAQSGTIQGIIIDQKLGDPLIGATIRLVGTELGTATDIDGFFSLERVPAGTYSLQLSYVSFKTESLENVKVEDGKVTSIKFGMIEESETLQEVV